MCFHFTKFIVKVFYKPHQFSVRLIAKAKNGVPVAITVRNIFDREMYVGSNQWKLISKFILHVDMNNTELIIFGLIFMHA